MDHVRNTYTTSPRKQNTTSTLTTTGENKPMKEKVVHSYCKRQQQSFMFSSSNPSKLLIRLCWTNTRAALPISLKGHPPSFHLLLANVEYKHYFSDYTKQSQGSSWRNLAPQSHMVMVIRKLFAVWIK